MARQPGLRPSRHRSNTPEFARSTRVGEQVQREMAGLIREQMRDPRVLMLTVTSVDCSPDMKQARVYVSSLGSAQEQEAALQALRRAAGFLRTRLAERLRLRVVPQLQFAYDRSIEEGVRMSTLIDAAVATEGEHVPEPGMAHPGGDGGEGA